MNIVLFVGTTSTEVGKKEPTKFFGGETADIVEKEAESLLAQQFAAIPGSKEAQEFLAKHKPNPRTRRIRLDAETPGLAARVEVKKAMKDAADKVKADAQAKAKEAAPRRRQRSLDDLGAGLNGAAKKED